MMTELMTRIRKMTEEEGMKRGRPILLAVRVPDSVEYSRAIGVDLERWLGAGLVDLLITGGYFQLNDPAYSAALGRRYGVKVYPSLDESRVRDEAARKLRTSTATYRGRTLNALRAGADGVYLFNSFNPADPIWRELGSLEKLAAADKDYFASLLGQGAAAGGAYPHASFMKFPRLNPANPILLKAGAGEARALYVGDDFSRDPSHAFVVKLRLRFKEQVSPSALTVTLNGRELRNGRASDDWVEFSVDPRALRAGNNEVRVTLAADAPALSWTDVHCTVRRTPSN